MRFIRMCGIYETFRYIRSPSYEHDPADVLENKYKTLNDINGKLITYSHGIGYKVYSSPERFIEVLGNIPMDERVFHEVICPVPQKLKFDIDAPVDELSNYEIPIDCDPELAELINDLLGGSSLEEKYARIYDYIYNTICDTFYLTYGRTLEPSDIVVCKSSSPVGPSNKYSNHIIITNYYVSNNEQAYEFTRKVSNVLPRYCRKFLDMSVNKRLQNFRIATCHKINDDRVKQILTNHTISDTLITNVSGELLPDIHSNQCRTNIDKFNTKLSEDDIQNVLKLCTDTSQQLSFISGGLFVFRRLMGSYCDMCDREHTTDNTFMLVAYNNDGLITVHKQCRRYTEENGKNGKHSIKIGEFQSSLFVPGSSNSSTSQETLQRDAQQSVQQTVQQTVQQKSLCSWADKLIIKTIDKPFVQIKTLFDKLPDASKSVYSESVLRSFEFTDTLVVHAAMKMGKTKALQSYIAQYFDVGLTNPIIRFVSFRQTFSGNIKEKFKDFELYSDIKGPLVAPKLIVQVESLHRLEIIPGSEAPDLLILDECESIFEQFDSGLLRGNFSECFAKFQYMMKFSKHVICMDANISDRTYRILEKMRPAFQSAINKGEIVYHHNEYKNATDDKYYITSDLLKWLGLLYSSVEADEKIAVPMSSLNEAKTLVHNLSRKYPQKTIRLYSSESSISEKREHFADVNLYWAQCDVLVYTPTVSAGVSFEQKHFTKVFGLFTDMSCNVEVCQQMIGRIRDVADHEFYIVLSATGNNLPIDIEDLKSDLYHKRENLMGKLDLTGLQVEYDKNGGIIYHTSDYFYLWLENLSIKNQSKNSFIQKFIYLIRSTGANTKYISSELYEGMFGEAMFVDGALNSNLVTIQKMHSDTKTEIRGDMCKNIASAAELTDEEVEQLNALIITQTDLTNDQKFAYEKHRLRVDYRYDGNIDSKFVDRYRDSKVRRIFKNLTRLSSYGNCDEAIIGIQSEERENHKYLMNLSESAQYQDINRKYVFDQHRYALQLLKLCGWNGIHDIRYIHQVELIYKLRKDMKLYWEIIKPACVEFGIKTPTIPAMHLCDTDEKLIAFLLSPINKILSIMYGITIISRKNDPKLFFPRHNSLFTTDPAVSKSKNIPLIIPFGQ